MTSFNRRTFLHLGAGFGAATTVAPGLVSSLALAKLPTDRRFIIILQRGAQDGLHALPPYGDDNYRRLRPRLAIPGPGKEGGALPVSGPFGLHPALKTLHRLYEEGDMTAIPAIASQYRERSHFDGQNFLENGAGKPFGADDGWLNRALSLMQDGDDERLGIALGHTVPLILRGAAGVRTWAPSTLPSVDEDFLGRLLNSYGEDALFAEALAESMNPIVSDMSINQREARAAARGQAPVITARAAAEALLLEDGPRMAVIEMGGWDTHYGQAGRLNSLFTALDDTVDVLSTDLASVWDKCLILTLSEFGRTAAENGSLGTDHGTGGTSFLLGGAVAGGQILGEWPGLAPNALYQGRDVAPANALEGVLKAILMDHLGAPRDGVNSIVFPNSDAIWPMMGLLK